MSEKRKILFVTNYCGLLTGFGMHIRALMSYIYKNYSDKYEIALAAEGQYHHNPDFGRWPFKIFGTLPIDAQSQEKLKTDPVFAQQASYGQFTIDLIVQDFKPQILIEIQDSWGLSHIKDMEFSKHIPVIYHVTIDSLPVLEQAFEVAATTKYYWTWSEFAAKKMRERTGFEHVKTQYPCIHSGEFKPLSASKKKELRAKFHIPEDAVVFGFVFRNQPRKLVNKLIDGFALFKKNNPDKKAFLLLHTSFHEHFDQRVGKQSWDIPRLIKDSGVDPQTVLCTYICRSTKEYFLAPFQGEELPNPNNNNSKTLFTVDVVAGTSIQQLAEIYNIMDLYAQISNSGSCEQPLCEAAFCGLPLAVPNYSFGEDVIELNSSAYSVPFDFTHEINTLFLKAIPRADGIAQIMLDFCNLSPEERKKKGEISREWALKNYDVKVNAEKILKAIDEIPPHNWDFKTELKHAKNPDYPLPDIKDDVAFILDLYKNILNVFDETAETKGCKDWQASLKNGVSREKVYEFFVGVARNDNRNAGTKQTFADLLEETGRPRLLFVLKESGGDILNSTSLLPSLKESYPGHDVYYACDPKFAGILLGNPNIHAIIPYDPIMEGELQMIGCGPHKGWFDVFIHAGIGCQRQLNYLSHNKLGLEVK